MIVNIKSRRGNGSYMWRKYKQVQEVELTQNNCVIIRKKNETKHYHSQDYKEFYTEKGGC